MGHPLLDRHRSSYFPLAERLRQDLLNAEAMQRADPGITDQRRRRNIRHLRQTAEARLNQLHLDYRNGIPRLMRSLIDPLFVLPTGHAADLSWRDAMRQAAAISDQDEALRTWEVALMVGDGIMCKALAYHACPHPETDPPRWPKVIAAWAASDPKALQAIDSFGELYQEANDKHVQFEDSLAFRLPPDHRPEPARDDPDSIPTLPQLPPPAATA